MHKRGALDLSIQTIVIVVIAMTLLGLGLGFVRNLFGTITDVSESTFQRISEQLSTDLATSDSPLIFSKSRLTLERRSSSLEGFGVRNSGGNSINYGFRVETFSCPEQKLTPPKACPNVENWFEYFRGANQYHLAAADREVSKVEIHVPSDATPGLYLLKLSIYMGTWPQAGDCLGDYNQIQNTGCSKIGQTELFLTVN